MKVRQGLRLAVRLARSFGLRRALGGLVLLALAPLLLLVVAAALQPLPMHR